MLLAARIDEDEEYFNFKANLFQGDDDSSDEDSAKKASRPAPAKKPRENKENAAAAEKSDKARPAVAVATTTPSRAPLAVAAKTPLNAASSTPGSAVRRNTMVNEVNIRICILCKGEGKKGGFNNGKAIDFKNKFMVKKKDGNRLVFQCLNFFYIQNIIWFLT